MKKEICLLMMIFLLASCTGCGSERNGTEPALSQAEEAADTAKADEKPETDFTQDRSGEIRQEVYSAQSDSAALQDELANVEEIAQRYALLAETAQTQGEMNVSSQWLFTVWDTELNTLWSRFEASAGRQAREELLAKQKNWIAMKEEVTLRKIGTREENGSMYPLLQNSFLEEITRNRAYVLADALAKVKGESFALPEKSERYGLFVDDQGVGAVYSSLITQRSWDGEDEALLSVYREGDIRGSFTDIGSGELLFCADDKSVTGIIQINGWDGASFQVTAAADHSPFSAGETFEFPVAF